ARVFPRTRAPRDAHRGVHRHARHVRVVPVADLRTTGRTRNIRHMMPPPFTAEQATKTLPLVSRIARDIVRLFAKWRERVAELELAAATSRAEEPDPRLAELERDT